MSFHNTEFTIRLFYFFFVFITSSLRALKDKLNMILIAVNSPFPYPLDCAAKVLDLRVFHPFDALDDLYHAMAGRDPLLCPIPMPLNRFVRNP